MCADHPPPSFKARHPGSYSDSHWSYWDTTSTACTPTASSSCSSWNSWPSLSKEVTNFGFLGNLWWGTCWVQADNVAQSVGCWVSGVSVGGTGGPGAGAWGHHMQHQHIARLAALLPLLPGSPNITCSAPVLYFGNSLFNSVSIS